MKRVWCFSVLMFVILINCFPLWAQTQLRIMAANLTSENQQSYPQPGPGMRMIQGLKPDLVLIQEFTIGSSASQSATVTDAFVLATFGEGYSWYREGGNEQIPNGIISRYPIIESGEWEDTEVSNRDFAYAKIDIPGDKDLWAVSLHFLTTGTSNRNREAGALRGFIQSNVPPGDYLVLGGDLNTGSRGESAISTLGSVVSTSGPYPVDQNGDGDTNSGRNDPYDWVLVDPALDSLETSVVIGSRTFTNGFVFDSRLFSQSELNSFYSSILQNDSGAPSMQHMAVIRDFDLDNDPVEPGDPGGYMRTY